MEEDGTTAEQLDAVLKDVENFHHSQPQAVQDVYTRWASMYDESVKKMNYNGVTIFYGEFSKFDLPRSGRILDVGAGTGLLGEMLQNDGYSTMDALDGNEAMLAAAEKKGFYQNCFVVMLGKESRISVDSDTYDAVLCCGCFGQGHMGADAFPELIRVAKPGGLILLLMHDWKLHPEWKDFNGPDFAATICRFQDSGAWELVCQPYAVPKWLMGEDGLMYVMRKN